MTAGRSHIRKGFVSDRRGVAFLEFTILFPLLLTLAIGVFEFGRALQHYHLINKSMRDAARYLARVPASCTSAGTSVGTVPDNYKTDARNLALTGVVSGGTPVLNYWTNPNSDAIDVDRIDPASQSPEYRTGANAFLPVMRVTASVPYADLGFLTVLGLGGFTYTVAHQQLHIGE